MSEKSLPRSPENHGPRCPPSTDFPHSPGDGGALTGRMGGGSFDTLAGPLTNMLNFEEGDFDERRIVLDHATGHPWHDR